MRTIIDLPEKQVAALIEFCTKEKISRAEAIRRAVGDMLSGQQETHRDAAFGTWASRGDSREMVDSLRSEWE